MAPARAVKHGLPRSVKGRTPARDVTQPIVGASAWQMRLTKPQGFSRGNSYFYTTRKTHLFAKPGPKRTGCANSFRLHLRGHVIVQSVTDPVLAGSAGDSGACGHQKIMHSR